MKFLCSLLIAFFLGYAIRSFFVPRDSKPNSIEQDIDQADRVEGAHRISDNKKPHVTNLKGSEEVSSARSSSADLQLHDALGSIGELSPRLLENLNLDLFDSNLAPISETWSLLGVSEDQAEIISNEMKQIFDRLREEETKDFKVLRQSDEATQIVLPALDLEIRRSFKNDIQMVFEGQFPESVSKPFTHSFISRHPTFTGGLTGRERVVTIKLASEDTVEKTSRNFEIQTHVLYEGARIDEINDNFENYSQDTGVELVERLPEHWSHLFSE